MPTEDRAVHSSTHANGVTGGLSVHTLSKPLTSSLLRVGGLNGRDYLKLAVCSASGAVFGIAAEKARGKGLDI